MSGPNPRREPISVGLLLGALCTLSANTALAVQFQLFPFDPELSHFVQSYHHRPDPSSALDRLVDLDIDEFEGKAAQSNQPHARAVLMAFFAHVVRAAPAEVEPLAKRVVAEQTGASAAFTTEAIARGASANRREAIELISEGFSLPAENFETLMQLDFPYPEMRAADWHKMDVLWASFFATGESAYIEAIAEPLNLYAKPEDSWMARLRGLSRENPPPGTALHAEWVGLLTARAALFGLTVNAAQDVRVREVLRSFSGREDRVGDIAAKIVRDLESGAPGTRQ